MILSSLKNQRIIANAGSGKTYRLVSRYLELLKRGEPAERIIALTFTRKAAGEFLDRIFQRLREGTVAGDAESGLSAAECAAHLRQLIEKMPRLALGTLDSFFGRMVRAFPFECGLAGEITIMDGHALDLARREALDALFRGQADDEAFAAFLDLIRQQNRNSEGRNVTEALSREIDALHEGFLMTPTDRRWGEPSTIWPEGCALLTEENLPALTNSFERLVFESHADMEDEYRRHWESLFKEIRALRPGSTVPERAVKFALRALDPPAAAKDPGGFYLTVFRTKRFAFSSRERLMVASLGRGILRIELEGRLARSRALYDLVARFEQPYQELVRQAGRLTFADITGLLAAAEGAVWGGGAGRSFDRQQMDFRLDATYDHWLLDEFQDTSRLQWQALRNLVDEVVQSDTGRRSFFYVGDTKQAIYTWRGGDPWLFDEIAEHYNASGTQRIDIAEALDISRRSVPEILETVNALFDPAHLGRLQADLGFPQKTLDRWQSAWREHKPHDVTRDRGCFLWRSLEIGDEGKRETLDAEAARLISEIDPLGRGFTCGVLVQTNARAASVIEALRHAGIEARSEGRFNPCTDNDLGAALLSLLRAIAHPADTFSLRHVEMTPLWVLTGGDFEKFRLTTLRLIREQGFAGAIGQWVKNLPVTGHAFAVGRAGDFLAAAADFDSAHCGGTIDELVLALQNRSSMDDPAAGVVRVLTVHAAKGLDFDMVVLPDAGDGALASLRDDAPVYLHSEGGGGIRWGLDLPAKAVCAADPVLSVAYEKALAEDTYENLCGQYVAATRARRAVYVFSERLKESSNVKTFNRLLHESLPHGGGDFLAGNADWYREDARATPARQPLAIIALTGKPQIEARPASPSLPTVPSRRDAATLIAGNKALTTGTAVHQALALITWVDEDLPDFDSLSPAARKLVRDFLKSSAAQRLYTRPAQTHALWREQAFDVFVEGRWISGVFDRAVIYPDRAELFDYKTDTGEIGEAYREQMNLYRKSLAALTGFPREKISAFLVSVKSGRIQTVEDGGRPALAALAK